MGLFKTAATLALVFIVVKVLWLCLVLCGDEKTELFERRTYLIRRVVKERAGLAATPSMLNATFQGEWAIVTYSMTALALTNMAFDHPKTKDEAQSSTAELVRMAKEPQIQNFDRQLWNEKPLDALAKVNTGKKLKGHVGYLGHLGMILAANCALGGKKHLKLFQNISDYAKKLLLQSPFLVAETYPGECYIPDNTVLVAVIALYERLVE